jgi:electron transport complex protein RnfC
MRTRPGEIIAGAKIMRHALQADNVLIAIEDNKPQALASLKPYEDQYDWFSVREIPTRYPTGGEKQLIRILTGRDVPSHGLPLDLDLVVQNVATAAAVHHAINNMQPLISRIITVTGPGVKSPCNVEALIGTPMADLIEQAGGYADDADRLIMGGPMMGITLKTDVTPVIKATNCLLVQTPDSKREASTTRACIRCGECVKVCPMRLLPQQLYWYSRSRNFEQLQRHHLFDCIECGCCAEVCPSHIPLVQYYRFGKSEIWKKEQETRKADRARTRTEARAEREERIKAERKARHAAAASKKKTAGGASKQDEIKAAVARARARKAEQSSAREDT